MPDPREPMWRRYLRFFGANAEADFDDEVSFHLSERTAELEDQGHPPSAARRIAESEFGDVRRARRAVREIDRQAEQRRRPWQRLVGSVSAFGLDLRVAFRGLRANPSLVGASVLSLGLAIAINVVILATSEEVVWRPFSVPAMDRLVRVSATNTAHGWTGLPTSFPDFADWREQAKTIDLVAANGVALNWQRGEEAQLLRGVEVSAGYFAAHGVAPFIGREFGLADETSGQPIAILGEKLWRDHFGGDRAVIGQQISLDGQPHTVVGVVASKFDFFPWIPGKDVWVPINRSLDRGRDARYLIVLGRLHDGQPLTAAEAELAIIGKRLAAEYPNSNRDLVPRAVMALDAVVQPSARAAFLTLTLAFSLVLLLASANVANLIIARTTSRSRELGLRVALGAPRRRIVLLLGVESLLLALVGGLVGILLSIAGLAWLSSVLGPNDLGDQASFRLSWRVVGLGALLSLLAAVLFGLVPAARTKLDDLGTSIRDGGRTLTSGRRGGRARSILIAVELGLAALLLTTAGTTIRSGYQLANIPLGFSAREGVSFVTYLSERQYRDSSTVVAFAEAFVARLGGVPGVAAVGYASGQPIGGSGSTTYRVAGGLLDPTTEPLVAQRHLVSQGYFDALGVAVLGGRTFSPDDRLGSPRVIVVNETLARRHWPTASPVGKRLRIRETEWEIVGMVASVREFGTQDEPPPAVYVPAAQVGIRYLRFFVQSSRAAPDLEAAVRAVAVREAPGQPLASFVPLRSLADRGTREPRAIAELFALLGVVSIVLALVGVYGVASYTVATQTAEIGIRRALGATGRHIAFVVSQRGGRAALSGMLVGGLVAIPMGRGLAAGLSMIRVDGFDPGVSVAALVLVGMVLIVGFAVPARRAVSVSPVDALKRE